MALASLRRWLAPSRPAPRPRPTFRPRVEGLEDRLTPSGGLLDPTFGSGGIVNLTNTTNSQATSVAVQPDGKVVIAIGNFLVQRLNRDGSPDTTFNQTGSVTINAGKNDSADAVAIQPDGKILVGGSYSGGAVVARLNANGTLDKTFGSKGLWESSAGNVIKLVVLTDATHTTVTGIVAAAQATGGLEAIKLTPAGVLDKTFGSGGIAFVRLTGGQTETVAVAPSGEIYLAGYVVLSTTYWDGCIAAVTPSGALDTAFGNGAGYVRVAQAGNQNSEFFDVAVQTLTVNGQAVSRLLAIGDTITNNPDGSGSMYVYVAAYTPAGALDTSFGSGGWFIPSNHINAHPSRLTLEADGSIVVEWQQIVIDPSGATHAQMLIGHLTANGTADTSFGSDGTGFVAIPDGGAFWYPEGVTIDPTDGGIVACGHTRFPGNPPNQHAVAVRLTAP